MAKIDHIEMYINGETYKYNINVGKTGLFRCKLDWKVAQALGIESSYECKTLSELKGKILPAYNDYLEAKKIEERFIAIRYEANGFYSRDSNGRMLYNRFSDYFHDGFAHEANGLFLSFDVFIKVTASTGAVTWYTTVENEEGHRKDYQTHSVKGKLIPYSAEAIETLQKAREGIRKRSNILFNVVSKPDDELIAILTKGNLLSAPVDG